MDRLAMTASCLPALEADFGRYSPSPQSSVSSLRFATLSDLDSISSSLLFEDDTDSLASASLKSPITGPSDRNTGSAFGTVTSFECMAPKSTHCQEEVDNPTLGSNREFPSQESLDHSVESLNVFSGPLMVTPSRLPPATHVDVMPRRSKTEVSILAKSEVEARAWYAKLGLNESERMQCPAKKCNYISKSMRDLALHNRLHNLSDPSSCRYIKNGIRRVMVPHCCNASSMMDT